MERARCTIATAEKRSTVQILRTPGVAPAIVASLTVLATVDLIGIYHSHVSSPAYPSRTDAEQAFWPDATYVIVSLAGGGADIKGYRIAEMAVTEQPLSFE